MSEIKFRAWHKIRKKMYKVQNIDLLSKHIKVEITDLESRVYSFDDVILEQFTGLYDKNGEEIYENIYSTFISLN